MAEHDRQDIIDKYLRHKMTSEEKTAFETELAANDPLKIEVEIQQQLVKTVKAAKKRTALVEFLNEIEQEVEASALPTNSNNTEASKEENQTPTEAKIRRIRPLWAIAASVALLLALAWLILVNLPTSSPQQLAQKAFVPYEDKLTASLTASSFREEDKTAVYQEQLSKAMIDFDKENYVAAKKAFSNYKAATTGKNQGINDQLVDLYLAQIAFVNLQYQESIDLLKPLVKVEKSPVKIPATWYIALAYLGLNDTAKGQLFLNKIPKSDHDFGANATKLLNDLSQ